jgi:hypothetical protein
MSKAMMYREPFERYFLSKLASEYPAVFRMNELQIRICPAPEDSLSNWTVAEISPDLPDDLRDKVWSLAAKLQREIDIYLDEQSNDHHAA